MSHECSLVNSTLDARCSLPVSHTYRGNAISTLVKHSYFLCFHILPDSMAAKDEMRSLPHFAKTLHAMHVMLGKSTEGYIVTAIALLVYLSRGWAQRHPRICDPYAPAAHRIARGV